MFNTDWLLKRVLKAVLKRNIGRYLSSEIDLGQLDVDLGAGKLELKNVLLNCDVINGDLGDTGFLVKAGFVSSVRARLPALSSLTPGPCSVDVDDVLLTIIPAPINAAAASAPSSQCGANSPGQQHDRNASGFLAGVSLEEDLLQVEGGGLLAGAGSMLAGAAGAAISDGIKRIAGRLQALLAELRITATAVKLRLELPMPAPTAEPVPGGSHPAAAPKTVIVMLRIASIAVTDQSAAAAASRSAGGHAAASAAHPPGGSPGAASPTPNSSPAARPGSGNAQRGACASCVGGNAQRSGPLAGVAPHAGGGGAAEPPDQAAPWPADEVAKCVELHGVTLDVYEGAPLQVGFGGSSAAKGAGAGAADGSSSASTAAARAPADAPSPAAPAGSALKLVSAAGKQGVQARIVLRLTRGSGGGASATHCSVDAELGSLLLTLSQAHGACLRGAAEALQACVDAWAGPLRFDPSQGSKGLRTHRERWRGLEPEARRAGHRALSSSLNAALTLAAQRPVAEQRLMQYALLYALERFVAANEVAAAEGSFGPGPVMLVQAQRPAPGSMGGEVLVMRPHDPRLALLRAKALLLASLLPSSLTAVMAAGTHNMVVQIYAAAAAEAAARGAVSAELPRTAAREVAAAEALWRAELQRRYSVCAGYELMVAAQFGDLLIAATSG